MINVNHNEIYTFVLHFGRYTLKYLIQDTEDKKILLLTVYMIITDPLSFSNSRRLCVDCVYNYPKLLSGMIQIIKRWLLLLFCNANDNVVCVFHC